MKKNKLFFEKDNFVFNSCNYIEKRLLAIIDQKNIDSKIYIALSGGSTPIPILSMLKNRNLKWERLVFFMVDERCVNVNSTESNFNNIYNCFFKYINSDYHQVVKKENSYIETANLYEIEIINTIKVSLNDIPRFDLILLGMGEDGHTASLFPNTKALQEKERLVVFNKTNKEILDRITLTYPIILNSKEILVIAKGDKKKEIIDDIYKNININYPISKIVKNHNNLKWILEK